MALAPSLPQVLELDLAARIPGRPIVPSHLAWSQFSRPGNWSAVSRPYWLDRSWWPAVLIRLRSVYSAQHVGEAACVIVRLQRRAAAAAGGRSPPPSGMVSRAPGAAQTPRITDLRPLKVSNSSPKYCHVRHVAVVASALPFRLCTPQTDGCPAPRPAHIACHH